MLPIALVRRKWLPLLFYMLVALVFLPSLGWAADKKATQAPSATGGKDKECPPLFIKRPEGTLKLAEGSEGPCRFHLAANGERGFCVSGPDSYACNIEGMYGCNTAMFTLGACTT